MEVRDSDSMSGIGRDIPELSQFHTVFEEEIKKVIIGGNSKSCHLDPIPTTLLKECIDTIQLPTLTSIANRSLMKTCTCLQICNTGAIAKTTLDKSLLI